MPIHAQVILASVVGLVAWLASQILGVSGYWPIVIGVTAALSYLGIAVKLPT